MPLTSYTIGFTQKSAEEFFTKLRAAGVQRLLDVRLHNSSQLAGFAKRDDLKYFLKEIAGIEYEHVPELTPTKEMLDAYKKQGGEWATYAEAFLALLGERRVERAVSDTLLRDSCLLCSEHLPDFCHRRLALEYLIQHGHDIRVVHLT